MKQIINNNIRRALFWSFALVFVLGAPLFTLAEQRTSTSFVISSDDISVGGGRSTTSLSASSYRFLITPDAINPDLVYDLANAPSSFWSHVRSDGGDIRVTTQDGVTQVPREVSGFDYDNQKGSLFIGTSGGTAFYIYYGNPSATEPAADSAYGKYNVWESDAKLVAHLEDTNDSTVNQNNGTSATPPTYASGKIADAGVFVPASTSYLSHGATGMPYGGSVVTVLVWMNQTYNNSQQAPVEIETGGGKTFTLSIIEQGGTYYVWTDSVANNFIVAEENMPPTGEWCLVELNYDGSYLNYYLNGVFKAQYSLGVDTAWPVSVNIGRRSYGPSYFPGQIDEVRILSRLLSSDERAAYYANQNNPATFWTTGAEASVSSSFVMEDDLGGIATGENINSASYKACAGYPCTLSIEPPSITFSLTTNQVLLGTLSVSSVATGDVIASTSTNAVSGYVTTIVSDGNFRTNIGDYIQDVADGDISIGDDEYGIGLTGTDRSFTDERSVTTSPRTIASNSVSTTGSSVTVTFGAAVSVTVPAGNYQQTATLVSTGRF